jgi:hypothetical protein
MTASTQPVPSLLPRWLAVGMAVMGLLAIGTGMGAPTRTPVTPPVVVEADSTFPPFRGFMMDSLRRGRLSADSATATTPKPRARLRKRPATPADSVRPRYSPRGCMPE